MTFGSDSQAEPSESKCLLVVKVHHVACDGLSVATLDKELCTLLGQECSTNAGHNQYGPLCLNPGQSAMNALCLKLPPSPGQFHRYVQWMHGQHLSSESGHRDRAFWSQQFASLHLPVMPMPESHGQHTVEIIFPKGFPAKHSKLLALFAYWQCCRTRQEEVIIGGPFHGRPAEFWDVVGCFAHLLPYIIHMPKPFDLTQLLEDVDRKNCSRCAQTCTCSIESLGFRPEFPSHSLLGAFWRLGTGFCRAGFQKHDSSTFARGRSRLARL